VVLCVGAFGLHGMTPWWAPLMLAPAAAAMTDEFWKM
jgi:hypothetical protein